MAPPPPPLWRHLSPAEIAEKLKPHVGLYTRVSRGAIQKVFRFVLREDYTYELHEERSQRVGKTLEQVRMLYSGKWSSAAMDRLDRHKFVESHRMSNSMPHVG